LTNKVVNIILIRKSNIMKVQLLHLDVAAITHVREYHGDSNQYTP
jgi:hypothetical protein